MNDDIFTATTTWQAVQSSGLDITNGVFSVFNLSDRRVGFIKSSTIPTVENGFVFMDNQKDALKYSLLASENLYAKTDTGTADIGVVTA